MKNETKDSVAAELVKQVPIKDFYFDLIHPVASEVGHGLQGATRLALTPLSMLVWSRDQIGSYLDMALPAYFAKKGISKEKIIAPDPAIAVPVIEALRYSHKEELKAMFTNLLGASMTADMIDEHPGFVEIIKQLSPDECKMLKYLQTKQIMPMIKMRMIVDQNGGEKDLMPYFSDICYIVRCDYPKKFPEYLDNLGRLGLVDIVHDRYFTDKKIYEKLRGHSAFPFFDLPKDKMNETDGIYQMTEFGKKFVTVCIG